MRQYTEEFKRDAIELMKKEGITKASKDLHIARCTLYRWCQETNGGTSAEAEEETGSDMDAIMEKRSAEPPPADDSNEKTDDTDTVATAMAMLVIENTRLREIIQHLRDTISGLTDHNLF